MRVTSDFDVRTVTIGGLTSVRYLLPIRIGIVTAIATMRSVSLSCSHDTRCLMVKLNPYPNKSVSEHFRSGGGRCRAMHPRRHATDKRMVYRGGLDYLLANARAS
jgi:hypothetical protein